MNFVYSDPDESFPEAPVEFTDIDGSWKVFTLLEAFADEYGNWRVLDTLGQPFGDLPDSLGNDLLNWRWLRGIARRMKEAESKDQKM